MLSNRTLICAGLGVLMAVATTSGQAGTRGGLYDMNAMINEGHPFAATSRGLPPASMPPRPFMTPIAPPPPTLRYTQPPRPPLSPMTTAQTGARSMSQPYRPFGDGMADDWFNNFYISAGGGLHLLHDLEGSASAGGALTIESDPGFVLQGAIGTYLGRNFRIEAEGAYRTADYNEARAGGATVTPTGELKLATGMMNLHYDIDINMGSFRPYVGAGAGLAQIESTAASAGGISFAAKESTEFAYQAIIGVAYDISDEWTLGLDGRYVGTSDEDVSATAITLNIRHSL